MTVFTKIYRGSSELFAETNYCNSIYYTHIDCKSICIHGKRASRTTRSNENHERLIRKLGLIAVPCLECNSFILLEGRKAPYFLKTCYLLHDSNSAWQCILTCWSMLISIGPFSLTGADSEQFKKEKHKSPAWIFPYLFSFAFLNRRYCFKYSFLLALILIWW